MGRGGRLRFHRIAPCARTPSRRPSPARVRCTAVGSLWRRRPPWGPGSGSRLQLRCTDIMTLSKPTRDALQALPLEARAELVNELIGAANTLEVFGNPFARGDAAYARVKARQLGDLVRLLRYPRT